MNLSEATVMGLLALGACSKEEVSAPKPEPVVQPTPEVQDIYPESQLLHQSVEFTPPSGLEMSPEEFQQFVKGIGTEFAKDYNESFAKKSVEERSKKGALNETILGFARYLSKKSGGKIDKIFHAQFPGEKPVVSILELTQFLNQFFHADGSHLRVRTEDGVWLAELYRFSSTDKVAIHDNKGAGEYPVLYITENLTGPVPHILAEGDVSGELVQFYVNHQSSSADEISTELAAYPNFSHPDHTRLVAELTSDTLHHEAVHLLLVNRDKAVNYYQGCVQGKVSAAANFGEFATEGCFTPMQIQELCGYSAELEHSTYAGPWTQMDFIGKITDEDQPNFLFLVTLQPYTVASLSSYDQEAIAAQMRENEGRFEADLLKNIVGRPGYSVANTQAVGRQGYKDCLRLTDQLRAEVNKH